MADKTPKAEKNKSKTRKKNLPQKEKKPLAQRNAGASPVAGTKLALSVSDSREDKSCVAGKESEETHLPLQNPDSRNLSGKARTQFKPGQSGNPGGKSKELEEVRRLARSKGKKAINRLEYWMDSNDPKASVAATIAMLDRGFGKPAQAFEGSGEFLLHIRREVVSARD